MDRRWPTCDECGQLYDNWVAGEFARVPRLLHCMHAVCEKCLHAKRARGLDRVRCTVCDRVTRIDDVTSLACDWRKVATAYDLMRCADCCAVGRCPECGLDAPSSVECDFVCEDDARRADALHDESIKRRRVIVDTFRRLRHALDARESELLGAVDSTLNWIERVRDALVVELDDASHERDIARAAHVALDAAALADAVTVPPKQADRCASLLATLGNFRTTPSTSSPSKGDVDFVIRASVPDVWTVDVCADDALATIVMISDNTTTLRERRTIQQHDNTLTIHRALS